MAWHGGAKRSVVSKRAVLMRIGEASRDALGTATLRAFLETPVAGAVIRVNGTVISTAPQIIQRHVPIGVPITYRIELEVPLSAPEGPIHAAIAWEASTE